MKDNKNHSHGKHMLLMLLGCLVPILVIGGMKFFNIGGYGIAKYSSLLFLLCPLMHILMIVGIFNFGNKSCHEEKVNGKHINEDV